MSDLRDFLDGEARRVHARGDALDGVHRRVERRRRVRRVASGAVALALALAGLGLAYAAFGTADRRTGPGAGPVPGPTPTSDDETPATLPIEVLNGTTVEGLETSTALRLHTEGVLIRDGGYSVVAVAEATHQPPHTLLLCPPAYDHEAELLRKGFLPGARIQLALPDQDVGVRVILGADFAERAGRDPEALAVAEQFMDRRLEGSGAEALLSPGALAEFEDGIGGLSLYGYTTDPTTGYKIVGFSSESSGYRAIVRITSVDGDGSEQFRIAPATDGEGARLLVVDAELNEVPSTAAGTPAYDEVQAFVSRFLEARNHGAGAEGFLLDEAQAAYSAGEGRLELYGYASDPHLVGARIRQYDKLSVDRHRVVLRFVLADPEGPTRSVWEALVLEWRGGDDFTVVEAKRGVPDA